MVMVLVMLMSVMLVVLTLCFFLRDIKRFRNAFHRVFQRGPS